MLESPQLVFAELCVVVGTLAWLYINSTKSDDHYINYLSRPEISNVEVHESLDEIHDNGEIPDPKLIEAGLRACHRINDLDLTASFFETIKAKCGSKKNLDCLIQQIKPTLDELGISIIEDTNISEPFAEGSLCRATEKGCKKRAK